ncbi:MAG TPA: NAD(P)-binding protein, partial [Steroidobacteraceae bacterium]
DFVQGALVASATVLGGRLLEGYGATGDRGRGAAAAQDQPGYYPPLLNGMRGSHPGSFEAAHDLRNGAQVGRAIDTGESYDLVVVGAGISGLAAAQFFRARTSAAARILLLDNHDDFGGHAKRNEFQLGGRVELLNGGTLLIESPRPYSPVADGLMRELGIDVEALAKKCAHPDFYSHRGLRDGVFFDRETFGSDKLVAGPWSNEAVVAAYPLPARARADILRIEAGEVDFMPGLSSADKKLRLSKMSYRDFLRDVVKVDSATLTFYQARTHALWGVGIDAVAALDCWGVDVPGFKGMRLAPGSIPRMGFTPAGFAATGGSNTFHFPDGNASVARLLVRNLIPEAVPGHSAEDVVTARVAYDKLDRPGTPVRLRLSSIVVNAANVGASGADGTRVTYIRSGRVYSVHARNCVLACYNMMIPYLCPELPEKQKEALHSLVKTPLVYTSVALRNWQSFQKLGVSQVYAPGGFHTNFRLNWKVDIGVYRSPEEPEDPILLHMLRTPCRPGLTEQEQHKIGREELLATSFATFERNIRDQLARALGGGGFDPARDIEAITVNRWPHGYAPEYNPLFDPDVPEAQRPWVRGRVPCGRIAIANSDSGGGAYTDVAIDQADRAVQELLRS